jgi:PAS domain S-box-containing protein
MTMPPEPVPLLLVDDLEENLQALEALLRREGLVLLRARSGREALELLLRHDVALALVDVQMPEMDGFELAELMRGTSRTRRVPIIFLTAGLADAARRFRGYEAGAVDFLAKPLEPDVLRMKVDVFVELHRQRQEVARQRDEHTAIARENARLLAESRRAAAALGESERRLALALEAGQLGFWDWDVPSGRVHFGGLWATMLGYEPAAIEPNLGAWEALIHPDDRDAAARALADHLEGRTDFYEREHRLRHRDGSWRWILGRGRVVERDADGRALRAIGTHTDVTARRHAEEERRHAQALLQAVIDGSTAVIFAKDLDGRYFLANRALRELLGLSTEQAAGLTDEAIFAPGALAGIRANDREALEAAEPLLFEETVRLGGREATYLSCKFPLIDAGGRPYAVCGVSADVTELKRAQAALAARERELQSLADNSPDVLERVDREFRHVFVNAALERATGIPAAAFLGRTGRELGIPAAVCDAWEAAFREVFATGRPAALEFAYETPEGPRRYAARLVPEPGPSGEVEHVLGVSHDVTERHRFEERLRDADRRKDEFLATLAHELRNPLAPIRTGLEILQRVPAGDPAAVEARAMMERQLAHMVHLVDDLLEVSRISRGKLKLRRRRVALREVLDAAVEACRPLIAASRHELVVEGPAAPAWLDGDPTRLAQVVGNLLNNAAKYTPDGGRITLSAAVAGREAVLRVADTGVGIPPGMLPKIFEMFTQVDSALDRAGGGLGIGLSLVRMLVAKHGGTIEAHSEGEGRGSTFTVRLPLADPPAPRAEPEAPAPPAAAIAPPAPERRPLRVLVVDDNEDAAVSLARLLRLFGHATRVAGDGPQALEAAREFRPDVGLLDIGLPGMDGYELARRFRAEPDLAATRLVALTGWGTDEDRRRAREAGFDGHLVKPVAPDDIRAVLDAGARCDRLAGLPRD